MPSDYDLAAIMKRTQKTYIKRKKTGLDRRGNPLPLEKPIVEIGFDEIGQYKDRFVLPDRVRLFLYHLYTSMGETSYDAFLKSLFSQSQLDFPTLEQLILSYLPNYEHQLTIWLKTTEYPDEFLLD